MNLHTIVYELENLKDWEDIYTEIKQKIETEESFEYKIRLSETWKDKKTKKSDIKRIIKKYLNINLIPYRTLYDGTIRISSTLDFQNEIETCEDWEDIYKDIKATKEDGKSFGFTIKIVKDGTINVEKVKSDLINLRCQFSYKNKTIKIINKKYIEEELQNYEDWERTKKIIERIEKENLYFNYKIKIPNDKPWIIERIKRDLQFSDLKVKTSSRSVSISYDNNTTIRDIETSMSRLTDYYDIRRITIRYLFGYLKYDLVLNNNIFVVHAPNGFGKSNLLKSLRYCYNKEINKILKMPLVELSIEWTDELTDNDANDYGIIRISIINENGNYYFRYYNIRYDFEAFVQIPNNYKFKNMKKDNQKVTREIKYIHGYNESEFSSLKTFVRGGIGTDIVITKMYKIGIEKSIDIFNELIKPFFGEEKEVFLSYSTNIYSDEEYYFPKRNLNIINKTKPLKANKNIIGSGRKIGFDLLSDGEKYICYLLISLIFAPNRNYSLIILDEPELYLHVEWQELLVQTLDTIQNEVLIPSWDNKSGKKCQIIITSHSPYFINYPFIKVGNPEYEEE